MALVVPLPVWWLLGLSNLGFFIAAVPMTVALARRRQKLYLPPGFGWWLLFLLWTVLSTVNLRLTPSGTLPAPLSADAIPVAFRFAENLTTTIFLLWAVNLGKDELPWRRLRWLLAVLFFWTVGGGVFAVLHPGFEVTSFAQLVMPTSIGSNKYVHALIHPAASQIQFLGGIAHARPDAPWPYTNTWGNAIGLLLPWFVCTAMGNRRLRIPAIVLLVLAIVPVVQSLNRGMWVSLLLLVAYVGLRMLSMRRFVVVLAGLFIAAAAVAMVASSPLSATIVERQGPAAASDSIRALTTKRAIQLGESSPILGYGTTRPQMGSSHTIAVGKSASCQSCGNIPIGSNGQLWFVIVGQGFVGALFYVMFHLKVLWAFRRDNSVVAIAGSAMIVASLWFMLVYDRTLGLACIEMLGIALMVRHSRQHVPDPP